MTEHRTVKSWKVFDAQLYHLHRFHLQMFYSLSHLRLDLWCTHVRNAIHKICDMQDYLRIQLFEVEAFNLDMFDLHNHMNSKPTYLTHSNWIWLPKPSFWHLKPDDCMQSFSLSKSNNWQLHLQFVLLHKHKPADFFLHKHKLADFLCSAFRSLENWAEVIKVEDDLISVQSAAEQILQTLVQP